MGDMGHRKSQGFEIKFLEISKCVIFKTRIRFFIFSSGKLNIITTTVFFKTLGIIGGLKKITKKYFETEIFLKDFLRPIVKQGKEVVSCMLQFLLRCNERKKGQLKLFFRQL